MRFPTVLPRLIGGIVLSAVLGCGGAGDEAQPLGRIELALDSSPAGDYQEIRLDLARIDGLGGPQGDSGWRILGAPDRVVSLRRQPGEEDVPLAAQRSVSAGHYEQLRLVLGPRSTIRLQDGSLHALAVPMAEAGLSLANDFEVPVDGVSQARLRFDGAEVVRENHGDEISYALQLIGQATEKACGTISGRITDQETGEGLPGVPLFAEEIDASGHATIMRTAVSSEDGCYTLSLLPVGHTYYVVSRPYVNGVLYDPQASEALALSEKKSAARFSAELSISGGLGAVSGEVTPAAASDESDQLNLVRQFPASGAVSPWLIVDTTIALTYASETYSFASVPIGTYAVSATRSTVFYDGSVIG